MVTMSDYRDFRKNRRYRVEESAIVLGQSIIGQMANVSLGGLMFRYLSDRYSFPELISTVDIYFAGDVVCLRKIPVQTVFNREEERGSIYRALPMRQCGLQFKTVTPSLREQLQYLLTHHAVGGE